MLFFIVGIAGWRGEAKIMAFLMFILAPAREVNVFSWKYCVKWILGLFCASKSLSYL
jgi:hypothetical protein